MIAQADCTEFLRMMRMVDLNAAPEDRQALEQRHGQVWDAKELAGDFVVIGFMAPFVVVDRNADGLRGSLEFQHHPRFYFNWKEDRE
jgi:hypothetical protein